ncbi:unnamed protein product [Closterium sp. Yama58-4]|nr:unnamed protein product [Closterium sp. Yama58-4]
MSVRRMKTIYHMLHGPFLCRPKFPVFMASKWRLASFLSLAVWCAHLQPHGAASDALLDGWEPLGPEPKDQPTLALYRGWESAYGLQRGSLLPPSPLPLPPDLPPPTHLADCAARTLAREAAEGGPWRGTGGGGGGGEGIRWQDTWQQQTGGQEERASECCDWLPPRTPWVLGTVAANLALTRVAQRDIWAHQMLTSSATGAGGETCEGRRLLVVSWMPTDRHVSADPFHVIASQIHVMADFLGLAMQHNRTLVALPGSYGPALNSDCRELNQTGEWTCFFFPLTHPACSSLVSHLQANNHMPTCLSLHSQSSLLSQSQILSQLQQHLASPQEVVCIDSTFPTEPMAASAPVRGSSPERPVMVDRQGELYTMSAERAQLHWWRSQAVRFLLRWPSLHLCHVINRERHVSTGLHVAASLAPAIAAQASLLHSLSSGTVPGTTAATNTTFAIRYSKNLPNTTEEAAVLTEAGKASAQAHVLSTLDELIASTGRGELLTLDAVTIALGREPYLPRPIAAVHVIRGDEARTGGAGERAGEMAGETAGETAGQSGDQVTAAVSQALQRLQWLNLDLRRVWLSGDARETPFQQHLEERDWALLYSTLTRSPHAPLPAADAVANAARTGRVGGEEGDGLGNLSSSAAAAAEAMPGADVIFADLLTSSLADFLVADISTESGSLIHELRCTNGRLFSPVCDLTL